jgi:hypothetical protein
LSCVEPYGFTIFCRPFSTEIDEPDLDLLAKVIPKVTGAMNEQLMKFFSAEDVRKALFPVGDLKAPGVDGLHAIFFKKCWHILGDSLTKEVLEGVNNKTIPGDWNDLVIVLIPKVENLELVPQYRPISLCNVLYKVISKMIALRLKQVLDDIISPAQSAYVSGRLIGDNILLAY